jgi:subtilisin family serine protease
MFRSGKPRLTGRKIVLLPASDSSHMTAQSFEGSGRPLETRESVYANGPPSSPTSVYLPSIGVAIITAPPAGTISAESLRAGAEHVEDETYLYAVDTVDYARGFRDASQALYASLSAGASMAQTVTPTPTATPPTPFDQTTDTWGLQITRVTASSETGVGVKIAILDSGFDVTHPDFAGRAIVKYSTIANQSNDTDDVAGHGTHTTGTALGPKVPGQHEPRYGVGFGADIYVCKVLDDSGQGTDQSILAGIDWAVSQKCDIISMSLGRPPLTGEPFSNVYETVAARALAAGTLIVCAAGNESDRANGFIAPINHPANCPSIMAVAAIDENAAVAPFSCGGPQLNIAAPGVDVLSSWPTPRDYRVLSGTSMATPYVAGIAALWVEKTGLRGAALRTALMANAKKLPLPSSDVGSGLVQAP